MSLPDQIDTNGAWEDVLERLYQAFSSIFKCQPRKMVDGKPLVFDARCLDDPHEEGFWHIVSKGKGDDRLPDFPRACRITWIDAILDGTAPNLSRWRYVEGSGSTRLYFWLEQHDYVLILQEAPHTMSLVTAYHVEGYGRKDLERKRRKGVAF